MSEENIVRRFPVKRNIYTQSTGRLLAHRLSQIFQELGFDTQIAQGQENGVDIKVFENGRLIVAGEILNWSLYSDLSIERKNDIIRNLSECNCNKVLIYTCLKYESILKDLASYGISPLKLDYQILPKYFYDFYARQNKVRLRRVDSREARQYIKSKLQEYLQSIELLPRAAIVVTSSLV